jgi:sigma-B regulation protein RsbU (phosphoserine phosphatase)
MATTAIARLKSVDLFTGCSRAQLAAIDRLGVTLDLPAGVTLCAEARSGAEFFVLLAGLVEVQTGSGTAAVLRPGAWFGETALIDDAPRRATVRARTPITVLVFGKREFAGLRVINRGIRERLEHTSAQVVAGRAPTELPWYQPLPSGLSTMTCSRA